MRSPRKRPDAAAIIRDGIYRDSSFLRFLGVGPTAHHNASLSVRSIFLFSILRTKPRDNLLQKGAQLWNQCADSGSHGDFSWCTGFYCREMERRGSDSDALIHVHPRIASGGAIWSSWRVSLVAFLHMVGPTNPRLAILCARKRKNISTYLFIQWRVLIFLVFFSFFFWKLDSVKSITYVLFIGNII